MTWLPAFSARSATSAAVKPLFADPPREYATAPLWVWNDLLTEQQIRDTLRDLADQRVKQAFVHPRPGLMTPYLSADWFRLWKVALDEAAKLDMNLWIYDENSYPSGFAGGWVPELMPESRGMGVVLKESKSAPAWTEGVLRVFRLSDGAAPTDVSDAVRGGSAQPEGRYLVASIQRAGNSPWHGGRSYVNLLTPGVTEKFIEVTLEAYKREIGREFGGRVPGVFTDEPNIRPAGGLPWCPDLPEQFQKRWGYDLLAQLPSLTQEVGDWRRVRHNYFALLNELFIERWARPMYEWCERNGLEFTGHYWDHEWPHCVGVPDNMAMAAWQHRPGVDTLMNQYAEHTHAQFGNVRYCREVSSIANQLGRKRTLVELYGAGGWDLRFEDMKRIGDWLQVLGVNTMDEHLSYITLRGARKRDHPQSFSYHEPWWEAYHVNAQYLARLSCAMSQGEQINRVLVIEPTTTAWMYQGHEPKLRELGDSFFQFLMALEAAQIEYDLGCEDVIARHGQIENGRLRVAQRLYNQVVLPLGTENLDARTWDLLQDVARVSPANLLAGALPSRRAGELMTGGNPSQAWPTRPRVYRADELVAALARGPAPDGFWITRQAGDRGILFHHRRTLDDGQLLLLVNTSLDAPSAGTIESGLKGIERWDPYTGRAEPYAFESNGNGVKASFRLPPSGSLLLFLSKASLKPASAVAPSETRLAATGPMQVRRLEPNVLTLDYVDITVGGETLRDQYFYAANRLVWQKHGLDRNPWDSAVQFKDALISRTFPADSGFSASYRFTIDGPVPANLAIVIERADLYEVTCNSHPVRPRRGDWWLDKAFGRIEIAKAARPGENSVTITASPMTMFHELEPAYLLGDFALRPAARGFVVTADRPLQVNAGEPVLTHDIQPDGAMWLSGGIGFEPGVEDRAPAVTFDLGSEVALGSIQVWNYNEAHVRDLTARGAARIALSARGTTDAAEPLGEFDLARANGRAALPQTLGVAPKGRVRFVELKVLSNHAGVTYPAAGAPVDFGFVGLGEVRFLDRDGKVLEGVKITARTSELASMRRTAEHLIDGSGLSAQAGLGWNDQGHPFYAAGVGYQQRFRVERQTGRYIVSAPHWYGSVAKVLVNGDLAGYLTAPPWELDVTDELIRGENRVELVVIGTLRNTLGPHHAGQALGSAWPGMFQSGPKTGPPPGDQYSTVSYGLFEPFLLKQLTSVESSR